MSILIVGSVALDTVEAGGRTVVDALGGAAVYSSLAATRLHSDVSIVAVVGRDFPDEHLATLRSERVDTSGVEVADGLTFRWSGRYHEDMIGRDTLDTQLNAFADFQPKVSEDLADAEYVFLANIDPSLQLNVLSQVRAPKLVVADTMNFWIQGKRPEVLRLLERADVISLNDEEAWLLTGERNIHRAGRAILGMGPRRVLIKKGEHGAVMHGAGEVFSLPAVPIETVADPTGAGDAFAGGFVGCLAATGADEPAAFRRAVAYGTVLASFCVEDFSVAGLLRATPQAVRERYDHLARMTKVPEAC